MRKWLLLLVLVPFLLPVTASALTICASFRTATNNDDFGDNSSSHFYLDQPFTVSLSCPIGGASIGVNIANNDSGLTSITYSIETDSGGSPSGTVIVSGTILKAALPTYPNGTTYATTTMSASATVLGTGTTYHLVLSATNAGCTANCTFVYDGASGPYSNILKSASSPVSWSNLYGSGTHNIAFEIDAGATAASPSASSYSSVLWW